MRVSSWSGHFYFFLFSRAEEGPNHAISAPMADTPSPTAWHHIAIGDRGTVPVEVMEDRGHEIKVTYLLPIRGGLRQYLFVRRADFRPTSPLAP